MKTPRRQTQLIRARLERIEKAPLDWSSVDFAHGFAMVAKEAVFKAQDELHRIDDEGLARKLEAKLEKVRADLEALDRAVLESKRKKKSSARGLPPSGFGEPGPESLRKLLKF